MNLESTLNSPSLSLKSMFCRQKCQALILPHQVLSNEKYFLLIRTPQEKKRQPRHIYSRIVLKEAVLSRILKLQHFI